MTRQFDCSIVVMLEEKKIDIRRDYYYKKNECSNRQKDDIQRGGKSSRRLLVYLENNLKVKCGFLLCMCLYSNKSIAAASLSL